MTPLDSNQNEYGHEDGELLIYESNDDGTAVYYKATRSFVAFVDTDSGMVIDARIKVADEATARKISASTWEARYADED
jgi:predicted aconitase with swiveling domain